MPRTPNSQKVCIFEECTSTPVARGFCWKHYRCWRRYGDPKPHQSQIHGKPFAERFWSYVDRSGGPDACWEWIGRAQHKFGYGIINKDGKTAASHRVAWGLTNGPIPDGLRILHECDNPRCCNPGHLYAGTQADNIRDAITRGRKPRAPSATLMPEQVLAIREAASNGTSIKSIAIEYDVHRMTISRIVKRQTWDHLQ